MGGVFLEKVLIVSNTDFAKIVLTENSNDILNFQITASSEFEASKKLVSSNNYGIIIIDSPINNSLCEDFALYSAMNSLSGIIMLVDSIDFDKLSQSLAEYGIMVIQKPINPTLFTQSLLLAKSTSKRLDLYKKENIKLKNKINEIRITDRAKAVLIKYLHFSEPQAHRFIEKQAMDLRVTKAEVAQNILKTYDK